MNNMNKKTYMLPGDERIVAGNAEELCMNSVWAVGWIPTVPTSSICNNFAERGAGRGEDCHRYRRNLIRSHTDRICKRNITDGSLYYYRVPIFLSRGKGIL